MLHFCLNIPKSPCLLLFLMYCSQSGIPLPRIELPKFDCGIVKWRSFRNIYYSLVHVNQTIGNIDRFYYLLSWLTGPALFIIKAVLLSAINYEIAWKTLNERFENKRSLATTRINKLFAFRPISHEPLSFLSHFMMNTFQENITALSELVVDDLGFLVFYMASRVLDSNTR